MYSHELLTDLYSRLLEYFGPQQWWPGDSPFEVMVGAVLTQNTNWHNVEKAINNLKDAGVLSLEKMSDLPSGLLAEYIRPAGYYNIKAERLGNLFTFIRGSYNDDIETLFQQPLEVLREELLQVKGIGPETADSILLYAGEKPIFVVDTYTHRVLVRHDIIDQEYGYREIQEMFMDNLDQDSGFFNEYHALLVQVGKTFCKKRKPNCEACPLKGINGLP